MYAAILSEHMPAFEDVRSEISKLGLTVVGTAFEHPDEEPDNTVAWVLLGFQKLGRRDFPVAGYVRVASIDHPTGKSYIHVAGSPWYVNIYYRIMFWVMFRWYLRFG